LRHAGDAEAETLGLTTRDLPPDARIDQQAESAHVQHALQQLSARERSMLWLAYAQGSSHREIADAVGVKTPSVKQLLFRARKKMAGLLREAESRKPEAERFAR